MTYRYPVVYRIQALFGALLAGLILLGSVIAEIEAADLPDAFLHAFSFVVGLSILLLGLDFATRAITPMPQGLYVRWVRASLIPWRDILGWRYRPLGLIHIRLRRGPGVYVWPLLERYTELLDAIDKQHP